MKKYVKIICIGLAWCGLLRGNACAQDSGRTSYFPYSVGDILVYHVSQLSERQDDNKLTFVGDSIGDNGNHFFFVENHGFSVSVAKGFKMDSAGNVYAKNWWDDFEYWKVFDRNKDINEPWIAKENSPSLYGDTELGILLEINTDNNFGVTSPVKKVQVYNAEDTTETDGSVRNITYWKSGIGITKKINSEFGANFTLKGAVINGQVYGDTTTYQQPPPSIIQKDYFPYEVGDVLVYSVSDSSGNTLPDSRIEFISDSVDSQGNTWYTLKSSGYKAVVGELMVDSDKNIYATDWQNGNQEPWRLFDAYFDSEKPWIVQEKNQYFELADISSILDQDWRFGEKQYNYNAIGPIVEVHYYQSEDSSKKAFESEVNTIAEWDDEFGIISKYNANTKISYEIKGAVVDGDLRGDTLAIVTSSENRPEVPSEITLHQNYPNPFNPTTTIRFELDKPAEVSLTIYSVTGQVVDEIIENKHYSAGSYEVQYDAVNQRNISSGIYLYELKTSSFRVIRKMALIK